jgi:hypothetical protein
MGITLGVEGCRVRFLLVSPLAPAGCLQLELRAEAAARVVGLAQLFRKALVLGPPRARFETDDGQAGVGECLCDQPTHRPDADKKHVDFVGEP